MPKLSRRPIDLNISFADSDNNVYPVEAEESLRLWARMTETTPTNLADRTSLSPTYDGAPSTSKQQIGFNSYDTVTFSDTDGTNAQVTSTSGLLSFSTAGDGGATSATTDLPFSVSMWVKMNSVSGVNEFFFNKNGSIAGFDVEYTAYLTPTAGGKIIFALYDYYSGGTSIQTITTTLTIPSNGFILGKWNHLVFTYDGRGGDGSSSATASQGMEMYINGSSVLGGTTAAGSGGYYGMEPGYSNPLYIGAAENATEELTSDVAEFAVWGLELSGGAVLALYNATRTMFYDLISGYVNNPIRTVLNSRDNATGSYPSILRTTGFEISNPTDPFNDTRTINFLTSSDITYPFVLDTGDTARYKNNWVSTPNFITGLAGVPGIVKPFVSDQGLSRSVHQAGEYVPFDESRIYIGDSQFYLTGTDRSVVPGFRSPLDDKVQIKIDLTNNAPQMMSRYMTRGMSGDFSQGTNGYNPVFTGLNFTGMRYYNFDSALWDQVGYEDPGTGEAITQTSWFTVEGGDGDSPSWLPGKGTPKFKSYQFAMSPQLGYMANDMDDLKKMGYSGIGAPTIAGAAPYSGSYHAKDGQLLSMSDYISHPFVLEKAVLEIPVLVRRQLGGPDGTDATYKAAGSNRDIDNYVFFVYRQRNPTVPNSTYIDSPTYCSGSKRYLVMSASMAFYNSRVFNETIRTELSSSGLPHTPSFSHDFDFAISGSDGAAYGGYSQLNNTLRVTMSPAVPSAYRAGGSRFPCRTDKNTGQTHWPTLVVQDYWPGGTTFQDTDVLGFPLPGSRGYQNNGNHAEGSERLDRSLQWGNSIHVTYNLKNTQSPVVPSAFNVTDFRPLRNPTGYGDLIPRYIESFYPGPLTPVTAGGTTWNGIGTSDIESSCDSPYILFPDDKLVFGLDAGISMIPTLGSVNPNFSAGLKTAGFAFYNAIGSAMSASFMQIKTGPASLTLFGSFVKNGREKLFQLNQNLTSDAIHEDLHYGNTVLDQYQIEPRTSYTGSYVDNLVIGVMDRQNKTGGDGIKNIFAQNVPDTITRYAALSLGSGTGSISQFYGVSSNRITRDPYGLASWNMKLKKNVNSGFFRGVRLFSDYERSYDTIMPDIIDFGQRSGMELSPLHLRGFGRSLALLTTFQGNLNEATDEDGTTHKKAYPYNTSKVRKLYSDVVLAFKAKDAGYSIVDGTTYYAYRNHIRTTAENPLSNPDVVKAMLFKSGISISFKGGTTPGSAVQEFVFQNPGRFINLVGAFDAPLYPQGAQSFLYGIENTSPIRSSAVFRSDHYGQFRDMLEQRKDRRYFSRKSRRALDAVVECQFVSSSDGMTIVEPHSTRSSNLSQWSTSSMPFFDEVDRYPNGRNRPALSRFRGISIFLGTGRRRSIFTS